MAKSEKYPQKHEILEVDKDTIIIAEDIKKDPSDNDSIKNVDTKRIQNEKKYPQKSGVFYTCKICDYNTSRKTDFTRHIDSKACANTFLAQKYSQNGSSYICEHCHYESRILSNFRKHLKTNKHHNNMERIKQEKQKKEAIKNNDTSNDVVSAPSKDIVEVLVQQNQVLQDKILEMASQPKIIVNNHTQNTQNNNQKTNIIQFLNNDCKDALNLSDFIKQLVVTFDDLETIENQGYVSSIKDTLIKSLGDMETEKRPIHCTDVKRKQFYVKDNDTWEKEKGSHIKLCNALNDYNNKQLLTMQEWKEQNPGWSVIDEKQDKVNRLTKEVASLSSIQNKLIHEIGEMTKICLKSNSDK